MPTMPDRAQARLFADLIGQLEPNVKRGFMASVTDIQSNVDWARLLEELTAGNVEGAVAALNINPAAWAEYSAVVSDAYAKSGASTVAQVKRAGVASVGVRFRMDNPRAQAWIEQNVAERVRGFAQEQITAARQIIATGYSAGSGPRTIAIDLVGRAAPGGGREGGILGLDIPRATRLNNVTLGMRTAEGVRDLVIEHADGSLSLRYKVNKATAARIVKAYRAGTAVPQAERAISERQYANALLQDRGNTVAQTETANAVLGARDTEWKQLIDDGEVRAEAVIKTWRHRRGASRLHRPDHLAMSGTEVVGIDTPFVFPDGTAMQYAHDLAGGPKHIIRCGCSTEYRVDQSVGLV